MIIDKSIIGKKIRIEMCDRAGVVGELQSSDDEELLLLLSSGIVLHINPLSLDYWYLVSDKLPDITKSSDVIKTDKVRPRSLNGPVASPSPQI